MNPDIHPLIKKLEENPDGFTEVVGYPGSASGKGNHRVYLSLTLNAFIEVAPGDVIEIKEYGTTQKDQPQLFSYFILKKAKIALHKVSSINADELNSNLECNCNKENSNNAVAYMKTQPGGGGGMTLLDCQAIRDIHFADCVEDKRRDPQNANVPDTVLQEACNMEAQRLYQMCLRVVNSRGRTGPVRE
ncbi:MAG TPA: hypothetical protein VH396_06640 [Chitinophagaceae bacterium]|jgi:hypothetical protein